MMTVCEVFQAIVLCAAFVIVGVASGNAKNIAEIVPVCVGIILLAVFYALFNLLVYYVCQPYNSELKVKGYTFSLHMLECWLYVMAASMSLVRHWFSIWFLQLYWRLCSACRQHWCTIF